MTPLYAGPGYYFDEKGKWTCYVLGYNNNQLLYKFIILLIKPHFNLLLAN